MARAERAVFTNMCMIYDENNNVLVIDRQKEDWPGVTFPGGHVEKDESFVESVIREVKEESGLDIEHPQLCGIKQFQDNDDSRYVVLFFKANHFSGELKSSDEGDVFWVPRSELKNYRLSVDFMDMVKIFESDELNEFYYYKESDDWKFKLL